MGGRRFCRTRCGLDGMANRTSTVDRPLARTIVRKLWITQKTAALGALEGLSLETMLLFPFAAGYLIWLTLQGQNDFLASTGNTQLLLMAAGPITAIPLLLFAAGARQIPLATMGLLQYISPSIQLLLGLILYNEAFSADRLIGFMAIWAGLLLYSGEGLFNSLRNKKPA